MKWISVKDKLPPPNERVLLWISEFGKKKIIVGLRERLHVKYTIRTGENGVITEEKVDEDREEWAHDTDCMDADVFFCEESKVEVLSWRTLPEPPKDK